MGGGGGGGRPARSPKGGILHFEIGQLGGWGGSLGPGFGTGEVGVCGWFRMVGIVVVAVFGARELRVWGLVIERVLILEFGVVMRDIVRTKKRAGGCQCGSERLCWCPGEAECASGS